jgi:hypothetical protein
VPLRLTPDYRLGVAGTSVSVSLCPCQRRHRSRRPFGLHLPEKPSSDRVTRTNGFKIRCLAREWQMAVEALRSIFLCSLTGLVAPPRDIGATPRGTRRYYPAIGGSFEGPRLRGEVLPDGGDWLRSGRRRCRGRSSSTPGQCWRYSLCQSERRRRRARPRPRTRKPSSPRLAGSGTLNLGEGRFVALPDGLGAGDQRYGAVRLEPDVDILAR